MVAKRCPCGCNRLAPCARGLAMIAQAEARKKAAEPKQSRNVRFSSGTQREQVKKKKGGAGGVESLTNAIKEQFGEFLEKD